MDLLILWLGMCVSFSFRMCPQRWVIFEQGAFSIYPWCLLELQQLSVGNFHYLVLCVYMYLCVYKSWHIHAVHACEGQGTTVRSEFQPSVLLRQDPLLQLCYVSRVSRPMNLKINNPTVSALHLCNFGIKTMECAIWHFSWVLGIEFRSSA